MTRSDELDKISAESYASYIEDKVYFGMFPYLTMGLGEYHPPPPPPGAIGSMEFLTSTKVDGRTVQSYKRAWVVLRRPCFQWRK